MSKLRLTVIVAALAEVVLYGAFFYYIRSHANPRGDGLEWVAILPWTIGFLVTTVPALILASIGRLPRIAAGLASLAAVLGAVY